MLRRLKRDSVAAAAAYLLIAIAMTWPLVTVMDRLVAWDLGDPLFNCWVLLWTGGQLTRFLGGDTSALADYWNGNIFFPEPLTIAYSEHLTGQMIQILPVLAATGNVVFSYNLLFLSTFVLSGLGMYLLAREVTGQRWAGFVAGLAFAWAPYRIAQFSHLQVLSSGWMAFALFGLRRYFETGRTRALVGAVCSLVLLNWSCGYYTLFFSPFVALYCLYELADRGRLRDLRAWRNLVLAGGAVAIATLPFLLPYLEIRDRSGLGARPIEEVRSLSADTHAFVTASPGNRFWGERFTGRPQAEGEGFPGLTILALAAIGVVAGSRAAMRRSRQQSAPSSPWRLGAGGALASIAAVNGVCVLLLLIDGRVSIPFPSGVAIVRHLAWFANGTFIPLAVLVAVSPFSRRWLRGLPGSMMGFALGAALLSALLALGPVIRANGVPLAAGPYQLLYEFVPGFDGLRVPARFLMVTTLFLALLAGLGAAAIAGGRRRLGWAIAVVAAVGILAESWVVPLHTNVIVDPVGYAAPPSQVTAGRSLSKLYKYVRDIETPVVLVEFPFGDPAFDVQHVFYAGHHRRPLLNGYSGMFPQSYHDRAAVLAGIPRNEGHAWQVLMEAGVTHAIVHEAAFAHVRSHEVSEWLRRFGARDLVVEGTDRLLKLR